MSLRFEIPKIVRALHLAEYAPEYEAEIQVWVNPPRKTLQSYQDLLEGSLQSVDAAALEQAGQGVMAWFAELWSQGPEATRWTVEEIRELVEATGETDPGLWPWLTGESIRMIREHRRLEKKASRRP